MNTCQARTASGASAGRKGVVTAAFVAFTFTLPFEALSLGGWTLSDGGGDSFFSLAKLIGYVFFLSTLLDWRRCYARLPSVFWPFAVYLAVYAVRGLPGDQADAVMGRLFTRLQMLILLVAGANLLADRGVRNAVFLSLGLSCVIFSLGTGAGLLYEDSESAFGTTGRATALSEDPNKIATILTAGVLALAGLMAGPQSWPWWGRIGGGLAGLGVIAMIVQTGSRGGMLTLAAGLAALVVGERSAWRAGRNLFLAGLAGAFLVACVLNGEVAMTRWQSTLLDGEVAGRDVIASETLPLILEKPFFGWGPVTADYALGRAVGETIRGTHNLWLALLLETGLAGSIPYWAGLFLCLRSAWRARTGLAGPLPLTLMTALLIANLSLVWDIYKLHWLLLALAAAESVPAAAAFPLRARRPTPCRRPSPPFNPEEPCLPTTSNA